jgi:spore coat protein H
VAAFAAQRNPIAVHPAIADFGVESDLLSTGAFTMKLLWGNRFYQAWRRHARSFSTLAGMLLGVAVAAEGESTEVKPATGFFGDTRLHTVHLRFAADRWAAIEPARGGNPFGGPGGGGFDPGKMFAMMMAPQFLKDGDKDHDGRLTQAEIHGLSETWFSAWDKGKEGSLTRDQLAAGLNATMAPQGGGPPGMMLQGAEGKRNGLASMMGVEFKYVHAQMEVTDGVPAELRDVAVRYKGNGTFMEARGSLKRSFKVDLNKFKKDQKLAGQTTLNLHNNVTDASEMNEPLSYRLYRDAGVPAPRTAYAKVYLTVDGGQHDRAYVGLYSIVENVDKQFVHDRFASAEGALFKPVTPMLFGDLGDDWKPYNQTFDPKTSLTPAQQKRVIETCKLITFADDATLAAKLGEYFDLDNFARYLAVMVFLTDLDGLLGPGQNFYLYLNPATNKFHFIPWDQDHSFGQFRHSQQEREKLSILRPWDGQNRFLERVMNVEAFKQIYLARMKEFSETIFKPERFHRQVDELAAVLRPAVAEEPSGKLSGFDAAVAGKPQSGGLMGFIGLGGGGTKPIKGFVTARSASILEQVAGKSKGMTLSPERFGPGGGGPGAGPDDGGMGRMLAGPFAAALDGNGDEKMTRAEFDKGFDDWFVKWNVDHSGVLTGDQLRDGIARDLSPFRAGFGGPPGGPPPGGPGRDGPPRPGRPPAGEE